MKKINISAGCLFILLSLSPELKGQPLLNRLEQMEGQGEYAPQQYSSQSYPSQPYQSSGSTVNVNTYEGGGLQGNYNRGFAPENQWNRAEGMRYGEGRDFGGAEGMRYDQGRGFEEGMRYGEGRGAEGMRHGEERGFKGSEGMRDEDMRRNSMDRHEGGKDFQHRGGEERGRHR
jgi:hypothetical protein